MNPETLGDKLRRMFPHAPYGAWLLRNDERGQALESIRDLLAHRAGIVDFQFREQVADHNTLKGYPVRQPLPVDGEMVSPYFCTVIDAGEFLIDFVGDWHEKRSAPKPKV